jgi:hypothetical protein
LKKKKKKKRKKSAKRSNERGTEIPCLHHMQPIDRHQIFEQEDPVEKNRKREDSSKWVAPNKISHQLVFSIALYMN